MCAEACQKDCLLHGGVTAPNHYKSTVFIKCTVTGCTVVYAATIQLGFAWHTNFVVVTTCSNEYRFRFDWLSIYNYGFCGTIINNSRHITKLNLGTKALGLCLQLHSELHTLNP